MAVRIPHYEQQVGTPGNLIAGADASVPHVPVMDLSGFDRFRQIREAKERETNENNARASIAAEEPKLQLAMAQKFQEVTTAWKPGDKPIADQMFEFGDTYGTDLQTRLQDPRARELATARITEMKTHYGLQGFAWETKANVDARIGQYEAGAQDIGTLASMDPAQFGQSAALWKASIEADTQIPATMKPEFIRKHLSAAALTATKVQAELHPEDTAAITGALLGITEPTVSQRVAGGDMYAAITKLESGGRMYGADGKVLRGPAIKTKDGGTIYAYGPYQMLESTAKAQAAKAGVEWKPELFFRDQTGDPMKDAEARQYHDLLGKSYIDAQAQEFGGNPVLIAAAHNMGPEAAKGWAEGRPYQTQSGKWWHPRGPMDMSALPEETRNYLAKLDVTEAAPTAGGAPVDVNSEAATAFRMLDPESLLAVRGIAMSQLAEQQRQQAAAMKVQSDLFKQRVQDITTAAEHGDAFDMPSDTELQTFLGPADAALTKQRLLNYQQMAGGLKKLPLLTNAELEAQANAPDPEGTDDRENRQHVRDAMAKRASELLAARKADPGRAAMESSGVVQDTYAAFAKASAAFHGAGPNATPDQFAALVKAQGDYVRTSFAMQRTWGITQPRLPAADVEKIAESFRVGLERDPSSAAARLAALPDVFGSDEAVAQVANKIGPLGWLAMDGVPGLTLGKLAAARKIPEADRAKLLPASVKPADVQREVTVALQPLLTTLAAQNDAVTAARYRDAAVTLTMDRLSQQGGSAKEAAKAAYAELFGDRNAVNGTYRVDATRYDPKALDARLQYVRDTIDPARLQVTPEPGFTLAESQQRKARTVRQQAYWVNDESGHGVYLMHGTGPVRDTRGQPIRVSFDDAMKVKPPAVQQKTAYQISQALTCRSAPRRR